MNWFNRKSPQHCKQSSMDMIEAENKKASDRLAKAFSAHKKTMREAIETAITKGQERNANTK